MITILKPRHLPLSVFSIIWQCNRETTIGAFGPNTRRNTRPWGAVMR